MKGAYTTTAPQSSIVTDLHKITITTTVAAASAAAQ